MLVLRPAAATLVLSPRPHCLAGVREAPLSQPEVQHQDLTAPGAIRPHPDREQSAAPSAFNLFRYRRDTGSSHRPELSERSKRQWGRARGAPLAETERCPWERWIGVRAQPGWEGASRVCGRDPPAMAQVAAGCRGAVGGGVGSREPRERSLCCPLCITAGSVQTATPGLQRAVVQSPARAHPAPPCWPGSLAQPPAIAATT